MLSVQPLDFTSSQLQPRPNATISTSGNENQIIQAGHQDMLKLTNSSSSSKAATTPARILITGRTATVHSMLLVANIQSAHRHQTAQVWKCSIELLQIHEICT
jgi:hypothetical protein